MVILLNPDGNFQFKLSYGQAYTIRFDNYHSKINVLHVFETNSQLSQNISAREEFQNIPYPSVPVVCLSVFILSHNNTWWSHAPILYTMLFNLK